MWFIVLTSSYLPFGVNRGKQAMEGHVVCLWQIWFPRGKQMNHTIPHVSNIKNVALINTNWLIFSLFPYLWGDCFL